MSRVQQQKFLVKINTNYCIRFHHLQKIDDSSSDKSMIETKKQIIILEDDQFGSLIINANEFNYYNGNLENITIVCYTDKDFPEYEINIEEQVVRIKQIYMNDILKIAFMEDMIKIHGLEPYHNDWEPAFFYGMMTENDVQMLQKNKSLKVIIWIGTDINMHGNINVKRARYQRIQQLSKVRHLAISSFIKNSLNSLSMPFKFVPFMGVNFDLYKPITKGPCIYLYTALCAESYYGYEIYSRLLEKYKDITFIITCCKYYYDQLIRDGKPLKYNIKCYDKEELINKIYPQCFLGLRLTNHDGLAGTVQELGLLGIKSIHNGESPSSLNYKTYDDVCVLIENEMKTIGTSDPVLAESVKKYLTVKSEFFNSDFYS